LSFSPWAASGTPITALSLTPGWEFSTSSTSDGYTLRPSTMITSRLRSRRVKYPSGLITAMSPVRIHPPDSTSAVSFGWFQYPRKTCGPRITSSPA
jgi:hypothetical protein